MATLLGTVVDNLGPGFIFPNFSSHAIKRFLNAIDPGGWRAKWKPQHFIRCQNKCESFEVDRTTHQAGYQSRMLPKGLVDIRNVLPPERTGVMDRMCPNIAVQNPNRAARHSNGAPGVNEISDCREDSNVPAPNLHANAHLGGPLVCSTDCKRLRGDRFEWRLEGLLQGVCGPCRNYIVATQAVVIPGEPACDCGPRPWRFGPANAGDRQSSALASTAQNDANGEPRHYHMCRKHIMAYWTPIANRAYAEWDRRECLKVTKRKRKDKNPYWGKKTKKTRTPWERAKATRVASNLYQEPHPRCFCGASIGQIAHGKYQPGGAGATNAGNDIRNRVRNCIGCDKFVRRW